jgi:hypothetical protein
MATGGRSSRQSWGGHSPIIFNGFRILADWLACGEMPFAQLELRREGSLRRGPVSWSLMFSHGGTTRRDRAGTSERGGLSGPTNLENLQKRLDQKRLDLSLRPAYTY